MCSPRRERSTSSSRARVAGAALVALATAALAAPPSALDLRVVGLDGAVTTVHELVGDRPAVVAFWASYCAPCKAEVPALNRALERWGPRGVRVIGVSLETDVARVKEAAKAWDARYDVYPLVEGQEKTTEALFPNGFPTSLFVRKGATTVHEKRLDDADLDRLVPPLLDAAAH